MRLRTSDLEIQEGRGSAATTPGCRRQDRNFGLCRRADHDARGGEGRRRASDWCGCCRTSPMSAMGFVDKNLRKPEDIKGKRVAITPADSMTQIWPLFPEEDRA